MTRLPLAACAVVVGLAVAAAGCGDESDHTSGDAPAECAGQPVASYDTFGQPFVTFHCQGCHAGTLSGDARLGAPPEVTFDDESLVLALSDRILARAAADAPTMPPAGGTTAEERARLKVWLTCFKDR
jgi:uncharacterized membrane protein